MRVRKKKHEFQKVRYKYEVRILEYIFLVMGGEALLRKGCPYSELFWSIFRRIRGENLTEHWHLRQGHKFL